MKRGLLALGVMVVVATVWFFIYTHPRHVHNTFSGIEYHAGVASVPVKRVTIQVNGTLQRSLNGVLTFKGTIQLKGNTKINPDNDRPLTVRFVGPGGMGIMAYGYYTNGQPVTYGYGSIFVNPHFGKLVILEGGWTATDGLTIAAPALNRAQAVSVSNQLMNSWLNGYAIK